MKPIQPNLSTPWNSLIWTEPPTGDPFRLADLTQGQTQKTKKVSGEEQTEPANSQPKDSFEIIDASRVLYIKSLIG